MTIGQEHRQQQEEGSQSQEPDRPQCTPLRLTLLKPLPVIEVAGKDMARNQLQAWMGRFVIRSTCPMIRVGPSGPGMGRAGVPWPVDM